MALLERTALERTATIVSLPLLLIAAAILPSRGQSGTVEASTPRQVAELLDNFVQPRFQKDAGIFGMGRIFMLNGHQRVNSSLKAETPAEAFLLGRAEQANRGYIIAFLHTTHFPGNYVKNPAESNVAAGLVQSRLTQLVERPFLPPLPPNDPEQKVYPRREYRDFERIAVSALPKLNKGQSVQRSTNDWLVVMKPVRATKSSCVGCHQGAKQGDTLGVMVYAVREQTAPVRAASAAQ